MIPFNGNVLVEKLDLPVFAMPALFNYCPNDASATLSTELWSGATYRISLQNIPANKICAYGRVYIYDPAAPASSSVYLGSQIGCVINLAYDDSMLPAGQTIEGRTLLVNYDIASQVSGITTFNVVPNNPNINVYPGFDLGWNNTTGETGYTLQWTDSVTSRSVNLPADTTTTKIVEDYSQPISSRSIICDGRTYTFRLTSHNAYTQSVSPPRQASCSRGYADPANGSGFMINGSQLQTRLQQSFNLVTDKTLADLMPLTIPLSIPNASGSTLVQGAIEIRTKITVTNSAGVTNTYLISEDTSFSTTNPTVNVPVTVEWPGVLAAGDRVQVDVTLNLVNFRGDAPPYASISTILPSNPSTGVQFYSAGPPTPDPYGSAPADGLAPGTTERSRSQIGKQGSLGTAFSNTKVLTAGRTYDLKVSLTGSDLPVVGPASDNTIMLSMDVTGSMRSQVSYQGGKVPRITAAKDAMKSFIDGTTDRNFVGLATFNLCNGKWNTSLFPELLWSYEGYNPDPQIKRYAAAGVVLQTPTRMINTEKAKLKQIIDRLQVTGPHGNICSGPMVPKGTNYGGGLTAGLAGLLGRPYTGTNENSPYTWSNLFTDDSIRKFPASITTPGRKYMVFASDGEQNAYPRSTDRDIFATSNSDTPINTAKKNNVPVYTMLMGNQSYRDSLINISSNTGGKYYAGVSGDEIVDNFKEILNDIKEVNATTTISYQLNTQYFDFADPSRFVFKIRRANDPNPQEVVLPNVSCSLSGGTNCSLNATTGVLTITSEFISPADRIYLYLKVIPKNDSDVRVDNIWVGAVDSSNNPLSRVNFNGTTDTYPIANVQIDILPEIGYFLAKIGNIYSLLGIVSNIPEEVPEPTRIFAPDISSLIFVGNPFQQTVKLQFGAGTAPAQRTLSYSEIDYNVVANSVRNPDGEVRILTNSPGSGQNLWNGYPEEVIKYQNSTDPLNLPANDITSTRKNKVIVSDADVYITGNVIVPEGNIIIVISKQSINIDKSVSRLDGIYLAEDQIKTYCTTTTYTCGKQPSLSTDPALELQGMFIAQNGFSLGRRGNLRVEPPIPGEVFVFRPDFLLYGSNYLGQNSIIYREVIE